MKGPPSRSPFSRRVTRAPSSTARRVATSPASPPPATMTRTALALGQREGGLVFHVLHAHALRTPDEDCQGVGTLDEILDLEPLLLGLFTVVLCGIYQATKVVEHALCLYAWR